MRKDLRIKICSFLMAAVLSFFGTFGTFAYIAYADSPKSWADVGEDVIKLRDAYFEYFRDVAEGDYIAAFVTSATDIPISWLKTLVDGKLAISPADDIYYWLKDGILQYIDNRSPKLRKQAVNNTVSICLNCKKPLALCTCESASGVASDIYPVISGEWLKKHAQDYNNRYKPMPNEEQFIVSWQNSSSNKYGTDSKFFAENVPVYEYTSGTWGGKRWNEVYILPFFYNDDDSRGYFYGQNFLHFYSSKEDDNTVMIHSDVYSFFDNSKLDTSSSSVVWDITNYPYLGYQLDGSFLALYAYKSSSGLFLGTYGTRECTRLSYFNSEMIYSLDTSSVTLSSLISYASPNFTPVTNTADDWGYIVSNKPFENMLNQTSIDFDKIPDNYYITIAGDNIYNYPITNPDTGDSTTITNYITNNYVINKEPSGGDTTNNFWNIDFPDFITNITTSIETAITNVFVADIDVINNYNQEMQDALNKKLPFLNDFGDIYKSLFVDIVDNNFVYAGDIKPTYNASSGGGTAEAGGTGESSGTIREEGALIYPRWRFDINFFGKDVTLTILDFSMYAEPLYYVRIVVCAFIYILYFVNLMRYLPTLIGNVMDMTSSVSAVSKLSRKDGDEK